MSIYCLGPEPTTPITPQLSSLSSNKRESARIYHNLVSYKFGWYFYTCNGHRYHFNSVYSWHSLTESKFGAWLRMCRETASSKLEWNKGNDIFRSVCRQMLFWFGSAWIFCYQACWVVFFGIPVSQETFFLQVVQNILDTERAHVSELQVSLLKFFIVFRWLCKDGSLALGSLHSFKLMSTFFCQRNDSVECMSTV